MKGGLSLYVGLASFCLGCSILSAGRCSAAEVAVSAALCAVGFALIPLGNGAGSMLLVGFLGGVLFVLWPTPIPYDLGGGSDCWMETHWGMPFVHSEELFASPRNFRALILDLVLGVASALGVALAALRLRPKPK